MALSQDRYISIKSTNVGDSAVTQRELGGLAFTLGKGWKNVNEPWDDGKKVVIYGVSQARNYFLDGSDEIKEAERYFSYISPSGTAPSSLTYVKMRVVAQEEGSTDPHYAVVCTTSKVSSSSITGVKVNAEIFIGKMGKKNAVYSFEYQNTSWTYGGNAISLADYGISVMGSSSTGGVINQPNDGNSATGTPASGDIIQVVVSDQLVWKKDGLKEGWYKLDDSSNAVANPLIETPNAVLHRTNADCNNFGSFNFIDLGEFTCGQFKDVAISNCGLNYKYLFCVACLDGQTTGAADAVKMDKVSTASFKAYLKAKAGEVDEEFVSDDGIKGTAVINGCDVFSATMPMAIFASTDYNGVNTSTNFMFKQFPGETPTVTSDDVADQFDKANINYYGLAQVNGQRKSFFQTGVNSDGESMSVYCNEIWLKSVISTDIMNLFLTVEQIPATADGESMIYSVLMSAAERGVRNGMITKSKPLTDAQKAAIYRLTGNADAWFVVYNSGYIGTVEIRQKDKKYIAYYKLIYSKGDSICKVEGSDILI